MPKKKNKKKNAIRKYAIRAVAGLVIIAILVLAFVLIKYYSPKQVKGDVAATVNGESIYLSEITQIKDLMAKSPYAGQTPEDSVILDQLINNKLLLQAARSEGLSVSEEEYSTTMALYYTQTGTTEEKFKNILEQQGIKFDIFKKDMTERLLMLKYINKTINPKIDVSDSKLKEYYDANKAKFITPTQIHAAHILVNSSQKAEEILGKLNAGGNFAELARNFSSCPSSKEGGDLGWFGDGDMEPNFYKAAAALDVNKISGVVKTSFGYHIIKLIDRALEKQMTFDEAKSEIATEFRSQQQNTLLLTTLQDLKAKAQIKILLKGNKEQTKLASFDDKGGKACTENGKPIIRLFTTSTCPHCRWINDGFEKVVKEYVDKGKIIAYHWELDKGDDLLTAVIETAVPTLEKEVFYKFNPARTVPTFVFGCRYVRIGNIYESQNDIAKEEADFRKVIDTLLAE